MKLAVKTAAAIESALQKDQGATFRGLLKDLMPQAADAYDTKNEPWRNHLGASLIGRECARELWYSFHWATLTQFDGRMLRLFNRGHLEEPRMVALLKMIGCTVWQVKDDGRQYRITGHKGHFGGSLDAVILGIPDMPEVPVLGEFKTHGEKSFAKLVAEGVLKAKWEHFVQMQVYMGKNQLLWALYMAVNKNTDELHLELIQFDETQYLRYLDRSASIIDSPTPPPKISTLGVSFFKCKFCDHKEVCHNGALPVRNCRTCAHSSPEGDGAWFCNIPEQPIGEGAGIRLTPEVQRVGCPNYAISSAFASK